MGLETGTYVSDLNTSNPTSTDVRSQGDDHFRLLKSVLQATFPNADKAFRFFDGAAKSADYVILSTDMNKFISMDASGGARNFTLPTLAASDDGWYVVLNKIDSSTNSVTITGTVNGVANPTLTAQWQSAKVWWSGSSWYMHKSVIAVNIDYTALAALTAPAVDDVLPIYDLSATTNKKIVLSDLVAVINVLTANTSPAIDDVLATYDTSAAAAKGMSFSDFLKTINVLTEDTAPDVGADYVVTYDASASAAKRVKLANVPFGGAQNLLHVRNEKASGTSDGTPVSGGTWNTVVLQTTKLNTIPGASLASNQFTLPAGTYVILAKHMQQAGNSGVSKLKLYDVTAAADALIGDSLQINNSPGGSWSLTCQVWGTFILAASHVMELRQYGGTNGGADTIASTVEVYADAMIWKVG